MERNNAPVEFTESELELIYQQALFQVYIAEDEEQWRHIAAKIEESRS